MSKPITLGGKTFTVERAKTRTIIGSLNEIVQIIKASQEASVYDLLTSEGAEKVTEALARLSEDPTMTSEIILDAYPTEIIQFVEILLEVNEFEEVKKLFTQVLAKHKKDGVA